MQRAVTIETFVDNDLVKHASGVWQLRGHDAFGYSDGIESERYLEQVFTSAHDLSTRSDELARQIKDWPSNYHLTQKRAQLLSGFSFDRSAKVLEVGCGCGAITRHLGENFDSVVSVEGSINRAKLAKLRTRDLSSVDIICAPFQEIRFRQKFDIIFVIGVFEYSGSFIDADNPYNAALKYFADLLTPNGMVVIAIENQFGLKYFNGCREDHLGKRFEGVEGYHRRDAKVRTFGRSELERQLKTYFPNVAFYYPYPDYKLPDCVVSEAFLKSDESGDLISQMAVREPSGPDKPLWDEPATVKELARNGLLPELSNSFLVIASRTQIQPTLFDQLGILYASGRKKNLTTCTRIISNESDRWSTSKRLLNGKDSIKVGKLTLVGSDTPWRHGTSLHGQVSLRTLAHDASLTDIFSPCQGWLKTLQSHAFERNGRSYVKGDRVDNIWQNYYPDDGGTFIDQEWIWDHDIALNVVVIRAIYHTLAKLDKQVSVAPALKIRSGRVLISTIAETLNVNLTSEDFAEFVELEKSVSSIVFGSDPAKVERHIKWFLLDRPSQKFATRAKNGIRLRASRLSQRIRSNSRSWKIKTSEF